MLRNPPLYATPQPNCLYGFREQRPERMCGTAPLGLDKGAKSHELPDGWRVCA